MKSRPYCYSSICDCGVKKDKRSQRCKACQYVFDKQLRRQHDPTLVKIDGRPAKRLMLTNDQAAYVSPRKWKEASKHNWSAWWNVKTQSYYAVRGEKSGGDRRTIHLQNFVFGPVSKGKRVDHISRNTLDCTDGNLREATRAENMWNSRKKKNNTSGYKGVTKHKKGGKWMAQIMVNKKHVYLGLFSTPEEAYAAYCAAAKKYHGEFACLS